MITRLKHAEIDFEAYARRINSSVQNNFYANREVIDLLCGRWDLLVYGDYEYIMPVPLTRKLGLNLVSMPVFIQQLGIFGPEDNVHLNELFLKKLLEIYIVESYSFNTLNTFKSNIGVRKNYIVEQQDYHLLYKKRFLKGRKSVLKKIEGLSVQVKEADRQTESFILRNFKGVKKKQDLVTFIQFIKKFCSKLQMWHVYSEDQLISVAVVTEDSKCYGLLALINDETHRSRNAASFLINEFLQQEIEHKSLDFMGGNIRGIEVFFKSFGADLVTYPVVQHSKKELIYKFLSKIIPN
ncbi:hypothetical protein FIC_01398 [Flavobacteriaceae bacterium 3519-10]|nr:hypothetical protein FIC_01398 [Flavobacteriaceae bacterium 3519-10]